MMGGMQGNKTGLAGEFRVMSELLLRGFNPAKSYLEDGADVILNDNGLRIEIKSAHRCHSQRKAKNKDKNYNVRDSYSFTLMGGARRQRQSLDGCDFLIAWCIDDDCFFILPKSIITSSTIAIIDVSGTGRTKYSPYRNRWDLLSGVKE